ncbi:MAG: hypothetical protein ABJF23_29960 [Bryobacteraceae bacterium]
MATRLEIKFEGTVPGLADHRLSLNAFGPSLSALLKALRRIATNMIGDALGPNDLATGRLKSTAKQLDIEIASIKNDCSGINGVVTLTTPVGFQLPLLSELTDRAMGEFMESLELEAHGTLRNSAVRKYLQTLPPGLTHHVYTYHNTNSTRTVELGTVALASVPKLPALREITGLIVGVGFGPGKSEIRVRQPEGKSQLTLPATEEQVNTAIALRGGAVRVLVVIADRPRVLRIESAASDRYKPSAEDRERLIFERWHNVLEELAK